MYCKWKYSLSFYMQNPEPPSQISTKLWWHYCLLIWFFLFLNEFIFLSNSLWGKFHCFWSTLNMLSCMMALLCLLVWRKFWSGLQFWHSGLSPLTEKERTPLNWLLCQKAQNLNCFCILFYQNPNISLHLVMRVANSKFSSYAIAYRGIFRLKCI